MLTPVWPDRDDFIDVNWDQIDPEMRGNFEKRPYGDPGFHTEGSVDPMHTPYDVLSAHKFWEMDQYLFWLNFVAHIFQQFLLKAAVWLLLA